VRARLALACLAAVCAGAAGEGRASPYGSYPLALPETLRGTVQVPLDGDRPAQVSTLGALYRALAACWTAPEGLRKLEGLEITARFALRRDGSVIGTPRITFAAGAPGPEARDVLVRATLRSIAACTPAPVTEGLGRAVAGRPLALRFVYRGPEGRGI